MVQSVAGQAELTSGVALKSEPQEQVLDLSVPAKKACLQQPACLQGKNECPEDVCEEALEGSEKNDDSPIDLSKSSRSSTSPQGCQCKCSGKRRSAERSPRETGAVLRPVPHNPSLDPAAAAAALGAMARLPFPVMYYPWPMAGLGVPGGIPGLSSLTGLPHGGMVPGLTPGLPGFPQGIPGLTSGLPGFGAGLPGFGLGGLAGFPAVPLPMYPGAPAKSPQTSPPSPTPTPSVVRPTPAVARPVTPPAPSIKPIPAVLRHKRAPRPPSEAEHDDESSDSMRKRTMEQRREANARERQRVQLLLQAFDDLRISLPAFSPSLEAGALAARPSKMWILRAATAYISALGALLERDPARPDSVDAFDDASDWLIMLLRQSGRVTASNLSDRPARHSLTDADSS